MFERLLAYSKQSKATNKGMKGCHAKGRMQGGDGHQQGHMGNSNMNYSANCVGGCH